jgi:hypothetical protein
MAWSRTTHALAYKSSTIDWKIMRLASSLKASVEQMDLLLTGFESMAEVVEEAPWRDINRKRELQAYFDAKISSNAIPSEATPKDYSRFISNCYDLLLILERSEARKTKRNFTDVDFIPSGIECIEDYLATVDNVSFPRSISLFQVVLGVWLVKFSFPEREKRWFPISQEMEMIFPDLRTVKQRFAHSVSL